MINNPKDPDEVEILISKIQTEYAKAMYTEIRDAVGLIANEIIILVEYPKPDGTPRVIEIHLRVDKANFEDFFLNMSKRRLLDDARRYLGIDPDDSGPVPDDPEEASE